MSIKLNVKLVLTLMLGLMFLLLPGILKGHNIYAGENNYFYERAVNLIDGNIPDKDELSYSGRDFNYVLAPIFILSFLGKIFSIKFLFISLPMLSGLISLYLFYLLLKRLNLNDNEAYLTTILFIISPLFIYSFGSYNILIFTLPLSFLALILFLKEENKFHKNLSLLIIFILGFFDYKIVLLFLLFILIYLIKNKKFKSFYSPLIIALISIAINYLPKVIKYGFGYSIKENYFKLLISDLGSSYGISIFLVFFAFFGLIYLWKIKYKNIHLYVAFILMLILSLLNKDFIIYFILLIFYLSSLGINNLIISRWESERIRKLTLFLLILGLLFSTYGSLSMVKNSVPDEALSSALTDLYNIGSRNDVVLSHYSYGILINSLGGKRNVIDSNFDYIPDLKERYPDIQKIFYSRNADLTKKLIDKYSIKYILITKEMKEGLVWTQNDEGLLFVMQNSQEFRKITSNDYAEVWRVR